MKWGTLIFWIFIVVIAVSSPVIRNYLEKVPEPTHAQLVSMHPTAARFEHELFPIDHYEYFDRLGEPVGVSFLTAKVPPKVIGYNSEVNSLVGIKPDGQLTGVTIVSHRETPHYIGLIREADFFDQFAGASVKDGLEGLDTVTSATVTSGAIIKDVRHGAQYVAKEHFNIGGQETVDVKGYKKFFSWQTLLTLFVVMFSIVTIKSGSRAMRITTPILSIVVIGVLLNIPITIGNFSNAMVGIFPITNIPVFILFIFAVAGAVLKGPIYCTYLCPFGALQEGIAQVTRKKIEPNDELRHGAERLRYYILAMYVIGALILGLTGFRHIEPFSGCFARTYDKGALYQAGVVLVVALVVTRVWCRYLCPTGFCLDALSHLGSKLRRQIRIDEETV